MQSWQEFYQNIKDPSWPSCVNEHEFRKLPQNIQDEIVHVHDGERFLSLGHDDIVDVFATDLKYNHDNNFDLEFFVANDFPVFYNTTLDGGGNTVGQRYPLVLKYLYPNRVFDHCLEWCSGHGAIGFRLLADGVCRHLHLLEKYQPAVDACEKTIKHMPKRFAHTVKIYQTDTVSSLPDIQFDLIVSNPPHFPLQLGNQLFKIPKQQHHRITVDKQWNIHREFFANIAQHLSPDGVILLQEIYHVDEFAEFIEQGGLKIKTMFAEKQSPLPWYLELTHR